MHSEGFDRSGVPHLNPQSLHNIPNLTKKESLPYGKLKVHSEGFDRSGVPHLNPQSFTISLILQKRKPSVWKASSALGRIRTLNPQSRNLVFYPVELRVQKTANI